MKKVNFNQIQNFEVPQEWIDKALTATPKPTPFLRRPYVIGSMIGIGVILVAVIVLVLVNPFQDNNHTENPAAVVSTEASEAAQGASEELHGDKNAIEDPDVTESVDDSETTETDAEETTGADEPQQQAESDTPSDGEEAVKYRIKKPWFVDTRSEKTGSAPEMNDTSLELEKSDLYTGEITIVISPDSPFFDAAEIKLAAYVEYEPDGPEIEGYGYLEPQEGENGEKIIRFNLFDEGAYTPSVEGYSFLFNFSDNQGNAARDMVTVDLISNNPVTITI